MTLSAEDKKQLQDKGISEQDFYNQIETFKNGIPNMKVLDYAHIGKGIKRLSKEDSETYSNTYEASKAKNIKFIPASGAATRMFRAVHQFMDEVVLKEDIIKSLLDTQDFSMLKPLIENLDKLAFYNDSLVLAKETFPSFDDLSKSEQSVLVLKTAVSQKGLNLASLPKGLIPFHEYKDKTFTPFEEHLEEAQSYANYDAQAHLHFTITEGHDDSFNAVFKEYLAKENKNNLNYHVDFSYQKSSTDTIAVNMDNTPYRDDNGKLFFRPGGHGALIHNLDSIEADIIFIKNIDNVSKKEKDKKDTTTYKKILAGMMINLQNQIFGYQNELGNNPSQTLIDEVRSFMKENLNFKDPSNDANELIEQLHKPIRICGMVKNDGAPGGGPFWIEDKEGNQSLQIVETSQMDLKDKSQKEILDNATHFNPVDIVCGVKDYKGEKFDLKKHVNPKSGFITQKSIKGQDIKALELPGLWNGAMFDWHSIFVEVPSSTFNPVKTVVDLLKPAHQEF